MAAADVENRLTGGTKGQKMPTLIKQLREYGEIAQQQLDSSGTVTPFDPTAYAGSKNVSVISTGTDVLDLNSAGNAAGVSPSASSAGGSNPFAILTGAGGSGGILSSPVVVVGLVLGGLILLPRILPLLRRG